MDSQRVIEFRDYFGPMCGIRCEKDSDGRDSRENSDFDPQCDDGSASHTI